jgi:hypothetical protein
VAEEIAMKSRFRLVRMKDWGETILLLCFMAALSIAPSQMKAASGHETADLRVYSYVSPPAGEVLERFGISNAEIETYARKGLRSRSIHRTGDDRLYRGSQDSLRVDVRRKKGELLLELSVRQGDSVHNMLERWSKRRLVPAGSALAAREFRRSLFGTVSVLLDELKSASGTPAYREGSMLPEDYVSEKDE